MDIAPRLVVCLSLKVRNGKMRKKGTPANSDPLSPKERSERMSRVRSKDTKVELFVRKLVYSLGYRYRLHVKALPGSPDMVFAGRKKVIFVHGCFWHRHDENCALTRWPKSKLEYWKPKLERNKERDKSNQSQLQILGWKVLIVWECEFKTSKNNMALARRIQAFLED